MKRDGINAGEKHLKVLGKKLFRVAVNISLGGNYTQKTVEEMVKATRGRKSEINGSKSIKAAREAVIKAVVDICSAREARNRKLRDFGVKKGISGKGCAVLPAGEMAARLGGRVRAAVRAAYRRGSLDLIVSGREDWTVELTSDPAAVRMITETYKDWDDRYGGRFKRWAKTAIDIKVIVPRRYLSRVVKRGLDVVDGLLTLDAQKLECQETGIEVFFAKWAAQGRGKSVNVETGFIARTTNRDYAFHGKTYFSALTGLRRKIACAEDPSEAGRRAEKAVKSFVRRWENKDFVVSIKDAFETGSCEYGVRSWCQTNNLPFDLGEAHIHEVAAAYAKHPLPEARRAILYAWARNSAVQ